jgi:hypothetical protein
MIGKTGKRLKGEKGKDFKPHFVFPFPRASCKNLFEEEK